MFTGIVQDLGRVVEAGAGHLRIESREIAEDAELGESISIDGVDLTVTGVSGHELSFDAMPETYRRSNLGDRRRGDPVNLERSVRPMDRLSGHLVRGVTEGTATLESMRPQGDAWICTYRVPSELLRYVIVKGPICIDGASLTVVAKTGETLSVSIVQYTQSHTNLVRRRIGERVNVETDLIARYVGELLREPGADTPSPKSPDPRS